MSSSSGTSVMARQSRAFVAAARICGPRLDCEGPTESINATTEAKRSFASRERATTLGSSGFIRSRLAGHGCATTSQWRLPQRRLKLSRLDLEIDRVAELVLQVVAQLG